MACRRCSTFGPSGRGVPTMPSADFCRPSRGLATSVALSGRTTDLPGYCALTFTLMRVGSTPPRAVQVPGFACICLLTPPRRLISASCSSSQRFAYSFLRIPSRPGHPCRSANTSPCRVCRGLAPPSERALPGAQRKRPAEPAFVSRHPGESRGPGI
ncbi:MAG: hypothetical protein ACRENW_08565, partial [Thermodesulfobacteriota bacterium]